MRRSLFLRQLLATAAVAALAGTATADWPQWRGLARDGRSNDAGLLQEWPEGGPPLAWKSNGLGGGYSSVSVAGDRVFTMGDLGDGQFVIALARADGSHLWKTRVGETHEDQYLGPRSTPTVDGDRIYLVTTDGDVVCLSADSGEKKWSRSLPDEFGGRLMKAMGTYDWKFAESPLVDGARLIVTPGAADATLVALDKMSGKEIWRASVPELGEAGADGAGYSSVVISEAGGIRQYVQLIGRGLVGIEAASGRFLWGYNRVANDVANIATPLIKDDLVFASTGYGTGAALVRLAADGDGIRADEVYFLEAETFQNHHGGLILHDGHVYTGTGHNKGFPIAVSFETGEVAWGPIRNEGQSSAAIAYADGRLYMRYQNGLMILVEATAEGYRESGSFMIPEVEKESWPHPVITDGRLYLREQDTLWVYDVSSSGRAANPASAPASESP
jgi:outer membrane protein assembly factor BamB